MYSVERTNTFKRSLKRCLKRGLDPAKLDECISLAPKDTEINVVFLSFHFVEYLRSGNRRFGNGRFGNRRFGM